MVDSRPNPLAAGEAPQPHDRDDAASVLSRTGEDATPGGGSPAGNGMTAPAPAAGAATPNSPIDSHVASAGEPGAEARTRAEEDR